MNFWQIQAAARRKTRARNDILGLLEHCHRRKRTNKKTQPVIRKKFGIFAKSFTFKVKLNNDNERESVENGSLKSNGKFVARKPIDRKKSTAQKQTKRKRANASAAKNRMQAFHVLDLIDDNAVTNGKDQPEKQMANPIAVNDQCETIISNRDAVQNKDAPINRNVPKLQSNNDFLEFEADNPVDFSQTSVDFTIGTFDIMAQTSKRMRPLDSQIGHDLNNPRKSTSSIDFNGFDSHIKASGCKSSTNFDNSYNGFDESASTDSKSNVSNGAKQSDWSLNTPFVSDRSATEISFANKPTQEQNSIETAFTSNIEDFNSNGLNEFLPLPMGAQSNCSSSRCDKCDSRNPMQRELHLNASSNRNSSNSQQTDGLGSFNSCKELTDNSTTFNGFNAPSKIKPFTLSMIIRRKSLGAHHAYARIFGKIAHRHGSKLNSMSNVYGIEVK